MGSSRLEVHGLSKSFAKRGGDTLEVLSGIDFTIEAGEFVCLLGPSGCGKSTLLSIVGGFETADADWPWPAGLPACSSCT